MCSSGPLRDAGDAVNLLVSSCGVVSPKPWIRGERERWTRTSRAHDMSKSIAALIRSLFVRLPVAGPPGRAATRPAAVQMISRLAHTRLMVEDTPRSTSLWLGEKCKFLDGLIAGGQVDKHIVTRRTHQLVHVNFCNTSPTI